MATPQTQRKPTFFWQGVFILLPAAVLVVVSLVSLRQDERAAEEEARHRAGENVQSLARAMRASVNEELQRFLTLQNMRMMELNSASQPSVVNLEFPDVGQASAIEKWERDYPGFKLTELATPQARILCDGRQIEPPDFPAVPIPPKWFRELLPRQKELWESLRAASTPAQIETCRENFLHSQPSADAQQAAFYLSQPPEQSGGALLPTEAGISFEAFGCYKTLSATNARLTAPLLRSLWWEVIERPSLVSPRLLEMAAALTNRAGTDVRQKFIWTEQWWNAQTKVRAWMVPLRGISQATSHWNPPVFWAHWTGGSAGEALAFFKPTTFTNMGSDAEGVPLSGRGYEIWFVPRKVIDAIFDRALTENSFMIPDYASVEVTVEDRNFESAWNHGLMQEKVFRLPNPPIGSLSLDEVLEQSHWQLLGTAAQKFGSRTMPDGSSFELNYYLTDRDRMLSAERRRAKLFGALILGAAFTALIGLLVARRAFVRQLQFNEQKSNFVSSVSHELRAPIASVRLMAENLERGKIPEPAKQNEYFRFIVQECRRLSSLIENVLDFSRIEQGRKQYEFEPTDLVALTGTTVKLMEPYAAEKGVKLELGTFNIQHSTSNIELEVDGRAIQQALVNLIDNAIKHSAKGQTVTVGLEMKNEELRMKKGGAASPITHHTSHINLSVSDHGPGIPPAEQKKIFERFYRLGSELRRETQGVGIGLSVVKHIVEAHGGRVTVESEVGQGSRFTVELPVEK